MTKRTVLRERVIIRKRVVTDRRRVRTKLRKERLEVDADEGLDVEIEEDEQLPRGRRRGR